MSKSYPPDPHLTFTRPGPGPELDNLPLQAYEVMNEVMDEVSPNFVHCIRKIARSLV